MPHATEEKVIPKRCKVLVVGGGPAGSYAASVLAREGIDAVVLEGDKFPRYHVGESMLPSMRHFLKFIDLDSTFDSFGFQIKKGASFKLNSSRDAAYTDFVAATGPKGYTWNVRRADADNLLFQHAGHSGAQIFDGVKVDGLKFQPPDSNDTVTTFDPTNPGRAVSASWFSKEQGTSGEISFDYLVDASGRFGLMSCKYLKNRQYNQGLKNMANWGYWKGAESYAKGTPREGSPYFEHLQDTSGWVWFIPLHDGTTSVGVVMNQSVATSKKKALPDPSTKEFYLNTLRTEVPGIHDLLSSATLAEEKIHSASDWSYSASSYAATNVRLAGDAACFIDPFFSSGVHLALTTGLSAATTICASMRGHCDEGKAGAWHTAKVQEVYTRFLLVVLSALKQIRQGDENVLDFDESGFERAFAHFRPIIQGTADVGAKLTQDEVSKTLDFCVGAFIPSQPEKQQAILQKLKDNNIDIADAQAQNKATQELEGILTKEEMQILSTIRAREMMRQEDILNIDAFNSDAIDGLRANLKRGSLGLVEPPKESDAKKQDSDVLSLMMHEAEMFGKERPMQAKELSREDIKSEGIATPG